MDTDTIIARIEELEDQLRTLDRSRLNLMDEAMGLTDELCERDVHDFEDEILELADGGEIHFIVCQNCGNREQNGVVEPPEEIDLKGTRCPRCGPGSTYQEWPWWREAYVTCRDCRHRVPRYATQPRSRGTGC